MHDDAQGYRFLETFLLYEYLTLLYCTPLAYAQNCGSEYSQGYVHLLKININQNNKLGVKTVLQLEIQDATFS